MNPTDNNEDKLLESLREIEAVEPPAFLLSKIRQKIELQKEVPLYMSPGFVWKAASVFITLALLNIYIISHYQSYVENTASSDEELELISDNTDDNY